MPAARNLASAATAAALSLTLFAAPLTAQVRIIQTNSGSDTIHLIDPVANTVVGEIKGVPVNHGAAAAPDGSRLYFSSEAERVLAVVDSATRQIDQENPVDRTAEQHLDRPGRPARVRRHRVGPWRRRRH